MPIALIPFLLLIVPILEIVVFILVGGQIGLWPTLGFILLTAIIGTILLRWQGLNTINKLRNDLAASKIPARTMGDGMMLIIAGILLLTPGFVTDTIGFSLFLPPIRGAIFDFFASRIKVASMSSMAGGMGGNFGGAGFGSNQNKSTFDENEAESTSFDGKTVDLDESEFESRDPDTTSPWHDSNK